MKDKISSSLKEKYDILKKNWYNQIKQNKSEKIRLKQQSKAG